MMIILEMLLTSEDGDGDAGDLEVPEVVGHDGVEHGDGGHGQQLVSVGW